MNKKKIPCFTAKIDLSLADKLKNDLVSQGFTLHKPEYTIFQALKSGVTCTLYESGSLTVQGKNKDEFIEFYLEPEILQSFVYTHPLATIDFTPRIGVDEAGKGDYFGPLCTCALYADKLGIKKLIEMGVKDSKKLSDTTILKMGKAIKEDFHFSLVRLFPEKYNELYGKFHNLNRLLAWTHVAAIAEVQGKTNCNKAVIDQFAEKQVMITMLQQKKITIDLDQRHRGEEDVVVAAASILARMAFVEGLQQLGEKIGITLPKGASQEVIQAAKKILKCFGIEALDTLSKTHFKTRADILSSL